MNRRGFTILELTLASGVATVVIAAAFALFQTVDRADRKLEGKFERAAEIERTRRAFQNAFASIATSERPRPRTSPGSSGARTPAQGSSGDAAGEEKLARLQGGAKGGESGGEAPSGDSVAPPPPPRVSLTPDTGPDSDPFVSVTGAQRLELVLTNSPVPVMKREGAEQARMALAEKAGDDKRVNPTEEGGARAIRGVFSLKPQLGPPAKDVKPDFLDRQLMELWWTPLPPAQEDPTAEPLPLSFSAGYPVKLCSEVARCTWRVFKEGQWADQFNAVWLTDLPAYAEVQIDFGNGSSFKWLMEVDYTVMAEVTSADLDPEAAKGGGRADGRPGATGSNGRTMRSGSPINKGSQ